ncbi:MAG: NADH-quinone oxidoreductase subunit NuoK [Planctomycetaceae bacterium]|nr:NADH-quinone oxidoreductase subunit NuoK [Planctomycetota bacterium]NUN51285.1 NADH-quinone oxidoreductase subunit NuoK [Planctomycetaceae bacterium]
MTVQHYLLLSGLLFAVGLVGVLFRRNIIIVLMCLELMLSAANLAFVAFSRVHGNLQGQVMVFFSIAVAAAEAAVALSIIIALYRARGGVDVEDAAEMKG